MELGKEFVNILSYCSDPSGHFVGRPLKRATAKSAEKLQIEILDLMSGLGSGGHFV